MIKDDERRLGTRKEVLGGMTFPGEPNNAIPSDLAEYSGRSSLLLTSLSFTELSKQLDHFKRPSDHVVALAINSPLSRADMES